MELLDEFQSFIDGLCRTITVTSLSTVREKAKFITPVAVTNDDTDENFHKISVVILQNLLNYHDDSEMFSVESLNLLRDLIQTSGTVESVTKSKLMLLLHGTKLKLTSQRLCSWFVKVKLLKRIVIDDKNDRLQRWKTLASLTVSHPTVIGAINNLARDVTNKHLPNTFSPVEMELIDCTLPGLRGFCGINKVYINTAYIRSQMSTYSTTYHPDTRIGKSVAEIDICTISVHEFAHARLRQVTNNPNTSTPDLFTQQAVYTVNETPEFGRLAEVTFFYNQIDYWQSAADDKWDLDYFEQFIKAIESAAPIPLFNSKNYYIKRILSTTPGLDIDLDADDYYV